METTTNSSKSGNLFTNQMKKQVAQYVIVCTFLAIVNYVTDPSHGWVLWVIACWGLSLGMDLIRAYFRDEESKETK